MLRYKGQQNLQKQLEQNQLRIKGNFEIGLKARTKTKTKTITRARTDTNVKSEMKNESYLGLKRKLVVYRNNDKLYVDHAAAYALGLTNVRAIMLDKSHLIEMQLETLYELQNNRDIEIEYQEVNKEKENEVKTEKEDLVDTLEELDKGKYGIGIHGIDKGNSEEKQNIALNISSKGLNINNNSKTILSTSISLGTNEDAQRIMQNIKEYKLGNGTKTNVVIAVPLYLEDKDGKKTFLGFPDENKGISGQQYEEHCILDRVCSKLNRIPPEFILGYYCENTEGNQNFVKNLNHYSTLTPEQKENFNKEISLNMDDISKSQNELIANGNIEKLTQMKEKTQLLGFKSYMIDNSIRLAQEYGEHDRNINTKEKLNIDEQSKVDMPSETEKNRNMRIRKILLNTYKDVKLSDLTNAKENLRDGIQDLTRNNEEKEETER